MPWQVGVDEAGYGPNLGPLVMTVIACRVPKPKSCLWRHMRRAVRRQGEDDDGRLLVADSKVVFSQAKGLHALESSVLGFLSGSGLLAENALGTCLHDVLNCVSAKSVEEIQRETWFHGKTKLPVTVAPDGLKKGIDGWRKASKARDLHWGLAKSVLVAPTRFNGLIAKWGTKGAILGLGLCELLRPCTELPGDEPLEIVVDKHGGRNTYSAVLQHAFEEGMVLAREEGADRSVYDVIGLSRPVRITFMPRADTAAFCVALASMVCKYLREVLMGEFNGYWLDKLPGLEPTAGYPGDSSRFYEAIEPLLANAGLTREQVWRER